MTPEEVEAIVIRSVDQALEQASVNRQAFWVEPEKHYRSHERLDRLLDAFDSAQSVFWRSFFGIIILSVFVLGALSMGFRK